MPNEEYSCNKIIIILRIMRGCGKAKMQELAVAKSDLPLSYVTLIPIQQLGSKISIQNKFCIYGEEKLYYQ